MLTRVKDWLRRGGWFSLLELALVAALAITLAHWTWVAVAPRAVAASGLPSRSDASHAGPLIKRHLFGIAHEGTVVGAADASPASKLRLRGVISPAVPGAGRAVFTLENGKSATVGAGEAIAPGVVLHEVHPDHVLVSRDGALERIGLDRRAATLESSRRSR